MGRTLARAWCASGYQVVLGSSNSSLPAPEISTPVVCSYEDAALASKVIVIASSWQRSMAALKRVAPLIVGKILIDCSNPEPETGFGLLVGHTTSAAESYQAIVPDSPVVKALNH